MLQGKSGTHLVPHAPIMQNVFVILGLAVLTFVPSVPSLGMGRELETVRPLLSYSEVDLESLLPKDTLILNNPKAIEGFLKALDEEPPAWHVIYGSNGAGHMDRLFEENRTRDQRREGRPAIAQRVAFVWEGVVSGYDQATGGFRLAIGPKMIPTSWGLVRFKPYGLPSGLVAVPPSGLREGLRRRKAHGQTIDIDLVLTGRLVPEESIIYDFAHEEPGQGMVMPVVHIRRIDYFLTP